MLCISHRKNLQQLTSIKVPNFWVGQNSLVSYSAKERHSTGEYIVGWHEHFNPFRWKKKKRVVWSPRVKVSLAANWRSAWLCCMAKVSWSLQVGRQAGEPLLRALKVVVSKICLWLLTFCQKCELLLGLLKWEKNLSAGAFWTYWKLLRPSSFIILLSCWSRKLMVCPDLQDQANWGGLLRTFKRTYISFCIWT